jgi:hypothetical protein
MPLSRKLSKQTESLNRLLIEYASKIVRPTMRAPDLGWAARFQAVFVA